MCELTSTWPSRALSHDDIKLSAAAFRPGRLFRLSRHRDPAPVGVCHTVPVELSLLHCSGIDELSKEGTFGFRPALVNNSGSTRTIRFFRAGVNSFRDYPTTLAQQYSITAASPIVTMRIRWVSPIWNPPKFKEAIAAPSMRRLAGAPESARPAVPLALSWHLCVSARCGRRFGC